MTRPESEILQLPYVRAYLGYSDASKSARRSIIASMSLAIASDTKVGCPLSWMTTRLAVPPVARQSARQRSQKSSKPFLSIAIPAKKNGQHETEHESSRMSANRRPQSVHATFRTVLQLSCIRMPPRMTIYPHFPSNAMFRNKNTYQI